MTTADAATHWDRVYAENEETALSWFDADAGETFGLVAGLLAPGQAVLDVGGGTARLADRLIAAGLGPVTVLDIAAAALARLRRRLGAAAGALATVAADVTRWQAPRGAFALWHDRACFHFLTDPADQAAYIRRMDRALAPGGHALIVTFAADGPARCSGLAVERWSPERLAAAVEATVPGSFRPIGAERIEHKTPAGSLQRFQATLLRREPGGAA